MSHTRPSAPSESPDATVPVVAAVICRGGRYLLCRRPSHKRHGGLWEFPGGKVHEGESLEDAVRRELREELALGVTSVAGKPRFTARDPGSAFEILFLDARAEGEPVSMEHEALGWFSPEEAADLPLAPSDRRFVEAQLSGPPSHHQTRSMDRGL
jgi:8-oxo-dGTP diphosphatase